MERYEKLGKRRFDTFSQAIKLAFKRKAKIIVETGTVRIAGNWGDGLSTVIFGDYCQRVGGRLWTCDISKKNIKISKRVTKGYKEYINYIVSDSVQFLQSFPHQIDFLYLDSLDTRRNLETKSKKREVYKAQQHNLNEFQVIEHRLHKDSIVFIDDFFPKVGKPLYTVPYMQENGWKLLTEKNQALLVRC
jgi:predicted O-methyltransferase YrrM